MDMKGGRTRREEGHEERKDMKGGSAQREEGHEGKEDMRHEGREDTKGGRRGRGTMDCPNKGEEIAE